MQGNCSEPPTEAFMEVFGTVPTPRQLLPRQCVMLGNSRPFRIEGSSVWIDNVYLRAKRSEFFEQWMVEQTSKLWMTNVTVQANGPNTGEEPTAAEFCSAECATNGVEGSQFLQGMFSFGA